MQNMANAIKKISVQRGYDVTRYALSTFGGAGGQHACAVADALGMTSVLIHPLAGALSAYGIGLADVIAMRESAVEAPLTEDLAARLPDEAFRPLEESARAELAAQGAATGVPGAIQVTRRAHLRYDGTDTPVQVPYGSAAEMTAAFEQAYRTRFSFLMADKPVVVEAVSVEAVNVECRRHLRRRHRHFTAPPSRLHRRPRRTSGQHAPAHDASGLGMPSGVPIAEPQRGT